MPTWDWKGPFTISGLLANCMSDEQDWPPDGAAVYAITRAAWTGRPDHTASPLYFGGNTGESERFCTRVGDLVADMHGLCGETTGHHSGGQSIYEWCRKNRVHPGALFIGWATRTPWCDRCAEIELARQLIGPDLTWDTCSLLNKIRPPRCVEHAARL